jgi:uncharacterized protein (DUF427 family)
MGRWASCETIGGVSLTLGPGPLGNQPAGIYNRESPAREGLLYLEPSPRHIRGQVDGEFVVDSRYPRLLYEHGRLPIYLFPREDVRTALLEPSERLTSSANKGPARWWNLRLGDRLIESAAWDYPAAPSDAPPLEGLTAFRWDALDAWFEEDEPAIVHARDPYHRVDVLDTARRVRISLDGELLAETDRGKVIFETSLPPRWYLPSADVPVELIASETRSGCAYKGFASYFSVRVGDRLEADLAWTYEEPRQEVAPIAGMLAFFNERVDVELDGELQTRPLTPWSPNWPGPRSDGPPVISG